MSDVDFLRDGITGCQRCGLYKQCTGPVPWHGSVPNRIAVVGEAPGEQEDEKRRPFIGPSGAKIRGLLNRAGIDPNSVAWLNTVSCFPHGTPADSNVDACHVNKLAQLDLIDPAFVLLLGSVALRGFRRDLEVGKARGRPFTPAGMSFICFATYHPAAALRSKTFEVGLAEDLARFVELTTAENPWAMDWPFNCFYCNAPIYWWDADGIGTCEAHMPDEGYARRDLLRADYEDACRRLAQTGDLT